MANYDDIFNASAQKGTEDKSFVSFNKEVWAAQKKQERESAFAMIDETAQRMANDGSSRISVRWRQCAPAFWPARAWKPWSWCGELWSGCIRRR